MNFQLSIVSRMVLALSAAAVAVSCAEESLVTPAPEPARLLLPGEYRFIITRDDADPSLRPGSRVSYESVTSSRFETGDEIGVFASGDDETQIQNDVFAARPINGDSPIQVLAPPSGNVTQDLLTEIPTGDDIQYLFYYPMNKSWKRSDVINDTGFSYSVEADQSGKEGYEHSDFLWNYLDSDPQQPYQLISMHHLMANIVVKVNKDSIDGSKGVTLRNLPLSASGIQFTTQAPGSMHYDIAADTRSDISMFYTGQSGTYDVYRAVVPAWHTLTAGSDIITCTLYDRSGAPEEVTFKVARDITLRDGYCYTFTLCAAPKPAVPDVSDEDSWVLDVYDRSDNNKKVGLLCREYLRYQPSDNTKDLRTGTRGSSDVATLYDSGNDRNVTSQAWVFYKFRPGTEIPDLNHGTVLRMLYDIVGTTSHECNGNAVAAWPAPHTYGGVTSTSGGLFLVNHGHEWVYNAVDLHGENSVEFTELYMHGAEIEWQTDADGKFSISSFSVPEGLRISNYDAYIDGHIAIPADGSDPYVSYSPVSQGNDGLYYDADGCVVGAVDQKYLTCGQWNGAYPLVKIGYNNFWTNRSLREKILADGSATIECRNKKVDDLSTVDRQSENDTPWVDFDKKEDINLPLSYLYPHHSQYDVFNESDNPDKFAYLYNSKVIMSEGFIPESNDDRMTVHIPSETTLRNTFDYFSWRFGAKIMTSNVRTRRSDGGWSETVAEALAKDKISDT